MLLTAWGQPVFPPLDAAKSNTLDFYIKHWKSAIPALWMLKRDFQACARRAGQQDVAAYMVKRSGFMMSDGVNALWQKGKTQRALCPAHGVLPR